MEQESGMTHLFFVCFRIEAGACVCVNAGPPQVSVQLVAEPSRSGRKDENETKMKRNENAFIIVSHFEYNRERLNVVLDGGKQIFEPGTVSFRELKIFH